MLELDHVFFLVDDPAGAAERLEAAGWVLDAGRRHAGQGTRNRRLRWRERFFELLWVEDETEARANALRLDRRAHWRETGASPVGLALRGRPGADELPAFWPYDALGIRIWIHRDNEDHPERPMVFSLELDPALAAQRPDADAQTRPGELRELRVGGPAPPSLPAYAGPEVVHVAGPHGLELVVDPGGAALELAAGLTLRA
jgi:hypothetical protein